MIALMKNRDWVELLDTLGHDLNLPFDFDSSANGSTVSVPFVFVGDDLAVGPPRDLLGKMISAMGIRPEKVRIINLKDSRTQLRELAPQWVVALGPEATTQLVDNESSLEQLRGRLHPSSNEAKVLPTYHPAYLIRNPDSKKACWEDLQIVMQDAGLSR
jgi:Uracil DNA glycosylase superfamily